MADHEDHHAIIGSNDNFWRFSSRTGFDLTHPLHPTSAQPSPALKLRTSTTSITVDPAKCALVVIDMQNFFLSPAFGRQRGPGHAALDQLTSHAIPAARKACIRIVWLNWGVTTQDLQEMPPAVTRAFGFEVVRGDEGQRGTSMAADRQGAVRTGPKSYQGLGSECGVVVDPDTGADIDAGKLLMREQWNSRLYPPLDQIYEEGVKLERRPDVWIHKNRMSGMNSGSACEEFLVREGIKTLFFTGVNTDQSNLEVVSAEWEQRKVRLSIVCGRENAPQHLLRGNLCMSVLVATAFGYPPLRSGYSFHPSRFRTYKTQRFEPKSMSNRFGIRNCCLEF
nr:hypothetical protein CFP56_53258 [Quercus suber]